MLLVASAQNDSVKLLGRSVLEGAHLTFYLGEEGLGLETFGPFEAHGFSSVRAGDVLTAIFVALRCDIFGRVGSSDDHDALIAELTSFSEVVGVQDSTLELIKTFKVGYVGDMEVASASHDVVESFGCFFDVGHGAIGGVFSGDDLEVVGLGEELDVMHDGVKVDPVLDVGLLNTALDVVFENRTWREGRDVLTKVFLEGVIGEL